MWEDPKGVWGNQWITVKNSFKGVKNAFSQIWGKLKGNDPQTAKPQASPSAGNNP